MDFVTDQEQFWAGEFGDDYNERNCSERLKHSKIAMWATMLRSAHSISSVKEFGCNVGLNLLALNSLHQGLELHGVEINANAAKIASELGIASVVNGTIIENHTSDTVDLAFTAGVLIHINPSHLSAVYDNLVASSRRYVLIAEYYNPSPVSICYRGHSDRLFKRDFAGEMIGKYELKLVDYGFLYRNDNWAPQDDITWFLLEK